jgi:hypothetical protein
MYVCIAHYLHIKADIFRNVDYVLHVLTGHAKNSQVLTLESFELEFLKSL